jgi:hypothetical protein
VQRTTVESVKYHCLAHLTVQRNEKNTPSHPNVVIGWQTVADLQLSLPGMVAALVRPPGISFVQFIWFRRGGMVGVAEGFYRGACG